MTKLVMYSFEPSPPCRAVLMTAEIIGVPLEIKEVHLLKLEHLKDDFLKINPQHTLPTLQDDDFVFWDSHAIMGYLVNKYAKDDSLYPKDPQIRAKIDQYLHFETGVLFNITRMMLQPILFLGEKTVPQEKINALKEAYGLLDKFLEGKKWLVGDTYTIADISCISIISTVLKSDFNKFYKVIHDVDDYPNLKAWVKTCEEEIPSYQNSNLTGIIQLNEILRSIQ